jgi:hypothetical protein
MILPDLLKSRAKAGFSPPLLQGVIEASLEAEVEEQVNDTRSMSNRSLIALVARLDCTPIARSDRE